MKKNRKEEETRSKSKDGAINSINCIVSTNKDNITQQASGKTVTTRQTSNRKKARAAGAPIKRRLHYQPQQQ